MTSVSSRPVARLSSPGDIVATVPALCGFSPQDSVVVLSLRGARRRLGLTIRLDLPEPVLEGEAAQLLAERVAGDGGAAAVVVVFAPEQKPELVAAVVAACAAHSLTVSEALHVHDGRWSSYHCALACCPPEGTPVPAVPGLVAAQRALAGGAVLASRDELVRSLAAPCFLEAQRCEQALDSATVAWLRERDEAGVAPARAAALQRARGCLDLVAQGGSLGLETAAALAVTLHDAHVRDEVATWSLKRSDALLALLEQVLRLVVPPYDAPACTLLAWVAYARGDGSRANVGLDRALATDPHYSLALLLRQALDGAVPPQQVRRILRSTRHALREGQDRG